MRFYVVTFDISLGLYNILLTNSTYNRGQPVMNGGGDIFILVIFPRKLVPGNGVELYARRWQITTNIHFFCVRKEKNKKKNSIKKVTSYYINVI